MKINDICQNSANMIGISTVNISVINISNIPAINSVFMAGYWKNNRGYNNKHTWNNGN